MTVPSFLSVPAKDPTHTPEKGPKTMSHNPDGCALCKAGIVTYHQHAPADRVRVAADYGDEG